MLSFQQINNFTVLKWYLLHGEVSIKILVLKSFDKKERLNVTRDGDCNTYVKTFNLHSNENTASSNLLDAIVKTLSYELQLKKRFISKLHNQFDSAMKFTAMKFTSAAISLTSSLVCVTSTCILQ